ncbi:hypothetical protein EVAR_11203_1 [Eumeta japonica]|uniref:Uncharacterized protein n=1 Tax=Eumeta variegata TaxID=151549 RepID=A0A4C1U4B4_EUMVA|nr:hypothetical protein EVAR_11203_1 [Eumeta japonica]
MYSDAKLHGFAVIRTTDRDPLSTYEWNLCKHERVRTGLPARAPRTAARVSLLFSDFKKKLDKHNYDSNFAYNADETRLNWKSLPSKSLASMRENSAPGYKTSKERKSE